jgi:hypothetical protein
MSTNCLDTTNWSQVVPKEQQLGNQVKKAVGTEIKHGTLIFLGLFPYRGLGTEIKHGTLIFLGLFPYRGHSRNQFCNMIFSRHAL